MTDPNEPQDAHRDPGLSGAYRAAADEAPPAALDAAILSAARAAVAARPARVRPWWRRLTVPAAVAASTLLAVMLALTMQRHPPEAPEAVSPRTPPAAVTQSSRPGDVADQPGRAREAAPPPARQAAPAAAPVLRAEPAEKKAKAIAPVPPARDQAPGPAAPATEGRLAAPAAKAESRNAADSATPERASPAQLPAPAMAPAGAAPLPEAAARRVAPRPEIVWLEEIRELRRQGKHEEAVRRLAAFRTAYPDYPLPDDLK